MQFCLVKPAGRFKPGLTRWAEQNQFYPGKMPTLAGRKIVTQWTCPTVAGCTIGGGQEGLAAD